MLAGCGGTASETAQSSTTAQEQTSAQAADAGTEAADTESGSTKIADGDVDPDHILRFQTAARAYYSDFEAKIL